MATKQEIIDTVLRLKGEWQVAYEAEDRTPCPTDSQIAEEQRAYDALVDYIEAHDLNFSKWDPRGPESPNESAPVEGLKGLLP